MKTYAITYAKHEKITDQGKVKYLPGNFITYIPADDVEEAEDNFYEFFREDTNEIVDTVLFKGAIYR